jgi:hypothetical protein
MIAPMNRDYLLPRRRRLARHVRAHGWRALLGATTATGVFAGFLSASGAVWPLWAYVAVVAGLTAAILTTIGLRMRPGYGFPALLPRRRPDPAARAAADAARAAADAARGRPPQLGSVQQGPAPGRGARAVVRCDDPVYGAGLRVLLAPSRPLVVISSNRRDVGKDHELPLPLFADHGRRTRVEVDLRPFGIPLAPYAFERELPDGQDTDHTLAVKDLVFMPELAAVLTQDRLAGPDLDGDGVDDGPVMLPEHCVDPELLAERDVVVIGGPDTNFWHGALFEPVARQFAVPRSPVPLALDLRDTTRSGGAVYGSRSMSVRLTDLGAAFEHTREERTDLDERLYPTYGMALATRNPFAEAAGNSHWCVFVAGTRSLGTSGAVLGLVRMLRAMRADPDLNFFSCVPTAVPGRSARVSAVLYRTVEVEQAVLRRGGELTKRSRRTLTPRGVDPRYSDSYVPVGVEYLAYPGSAGAPPRWLPTDPRPPDRA